MYGFTIPAHVLDSYKCVSSHWMKTKYDENMVEWFPLKYEKKIKVKIKDHDGVDNGGYSRKIISPLYHLGSFVSSYSKRLMNDVMLSLDGFKNKKKLLFR